VTLPSGAEVFGHVPELAPDAWLHSLYPGLDDEELDALADALDRTVPAVYADWLRLTNGLELFVTALALYGVSRDRRRDPQNRQPFDLSIRNVHVRPGDAGDECFFIGSYDWDGSLLRRNLTGCPSTSMSKAASATPTGRRSPPDERKGPQLRDGSTTDCGAARD
jgi:hypothetical protein